MTCTDCNGTGQYTGFTETGPCLACYVPPDLSVRFCVFCEGPLHRFDDGTHKCFRCDTYYLKDGPAMTDDEWIA